MFRPLGISPTSWPLSVASRCVAQHFVAPHFIAPRFILKSSTRSLRSAAFCAFVVAATFVSLSPAASTAAHADTVLSDGGAKTAMPGGYVMMHGLRTAVVSATVSSGDAINAQRALVAANLAISRTRDFYSVPPSQVAEALNNLTKRGGTDLRLPSERRALSSPNAPYSEPEAGSANVRSELDAQDYRALAKKLKADRLLTVYVTPGEATDTSATFSAVVETYDKASGALVGRGEGSFTATLDVAAADAAVEKTLSSRPAISAAADKTSIQTDVPVANGVARSTTGEPLALPIRALGGAVFRAVQELNRPISLSGTVLSIPGPYQTRVSLSEYRGLRNGARVEYLDGGVPVAYGTVSSVGPGEAVVTVAPQASFSAIYVNMKVRNVNNPTVVRQGKTDQQLDNAEFSAFEKEFGIDLAVAGLIYLATK